jgi:hypothetical protein
MLLLLPACALPCVLPPLLPAALPGGAPPARASPRNASQRRIPGATQQRRTPRIAITGA